MRKVIFEEFGGPEKLLLKDAPDLVPGEDQLLVAVEAAGVNYLDITQRSGASAVHVIKPPFVLGLEGVGRILAIGSGAENAKDGFKVGMRVAWIDAPSSYASQVLVPACRAIVVPDDLEAHQGLLFQALTAHYLVHEYRAIQPGDRVLVHAASGGLGQLLVQWFKHLGAFVVGTVSSEEKAETVRSVGADAVVIYGNTYDFKDQVLDLTQGKGVNLAIDGIGEKTLLNTISVLSRGGTAVAIGAASGPIPQITPTILTPKGLRLAGGAVFSWVADPVELKARAAQAIEGIEAGWLKLDAATSYPLDQASKAHEDIESRRSKGKIYLIP
ncbi:quinone oxidoreductase [uncultured Cohaesibacter sp.]|uniref:quinone oxidoreductase family protein n=1 Tax=uncultured Cohaesibacter sp. TaxID=1002546 RepID=UPI00292F2432|nr:quinone oxidoreductase [uncultured Cohaesibacter sp.]